MLAWNAVATDQDGVPAGGTTGVAVRDKGTTTNEVPKAHEEVCCSAATDTTEWGGGGATAA